MVHNPRWVVAMWAEPTAQRLTGGKVTQQRVVSATNVEQPPYVPRVHPVSVVLVLVFLLPSNNLWVSVSLCGLTIHQLMDIGLS